MYTIKDIAKMANVSVATVSRVINNSGYVSKETRKIVLDVIDKTDYNVNRNAVKLSTGKSDIVGVVIPEVNHECYDTILQGILLEAEEINVKIMVLISKYEKKREEEFLKLLKNKEVDGLIFVSKMIDHQSLEQYSQYGSIANGRNDRINKVSNVYPMRYESYLHIYNYFISNDIDTTYVLVPRRADVSRSTKDKIKAYELTYKKDIHNNLVLGIRTEKEAYDFSKNVFKGSSKLAFHVSDNHIASGIINYANTLSLQLNKDYYIVSEHNSLSTKLLGIHHADYQLTLVGRYLFKSLYDKTMRNIGIDYIFTPK